MARSARLVAAARALRVAAFFAVPFALLAACDKGRASSSAGDDSVVKGDAPPLAAKAFYRVDARPVVPCPIGSTCEAKLVLSALGDYKVNGEYPTKFVPDPASEVAIEGHAFALDGAKRGTLTVRYKPDKAGTLKLVGTFKLSVCTEDNCEIEAPQIALRVAGT